MKHFEKAYAAYITSFRSSIITVKGVLLEWPDLYTEMVVSGKMAAMQA